MKLIYSLIFFLGRKSNKTNIAPKIPLGVISRQLFINIYSCKNYSELQACKEYVDKISEDYKDDMSTSYFKEVMSRTINTQSNQILKSNQYESSLVKI